MAVSIAIRRGLVPSRAQCGIQKGDRPMHVCLHAGNVGLSQHFLLTVHSSHAFQLSFCFPNVYDRPSDHISMKKSNRHTFEFFDS
jgi:hypothetical protein